jgi:GT2 family glycosyltransferase
MGLSGNVDHVFVGVPRYGQSYQNYIHRVINYSALTAACLMVSKQKFNEVNGFNEAFQVEFNDIDFCLRLKEAGYNHVYLPHVELYHHESISRGHPLANPASYERHLREFDLVQKTWRKYIDKDPCYNPNLSLTDKNMSVAY